MEDTQELNTILEQYKTAILTLFSQVEALEHHVNTLEGLLVDEVIGGIKNIATTEVRKEGISGLKTRYGERMTPLESVLPEFGVQDWGSELYDHLQEMKANDPDFNDEKEGLTVDELVKKIQDSVGRISSVTGAKPVAASVTLAKPEDVPEAVVEDKEPLDNTADMVAAVKRYRKQNQ